MAADKLFQDITRQMAETAIPRRIGVVDSTGKILACSSEELIGKEESSLQQILSESNAVFTFQGDTYKPFSTEEGNGYAVFVEGNDKTAVSFADILAVSFLNIKKYYDNKYSRNNFMRNLVLDNILPGDIYLKARDLNLASEATRVALLIRVLNANEFSALDVVEGLFPDKQKDFVFSIQDNEIVLIKDINDDIDSKDLKKLARSIVDTLSGEFYTRAAVGIGTKAEDIREIGRSFKEARLALEVGKVFDTDNSIVSYDHLGIARLIYQLPSTLCETFLDEIFHKGTIETLDQETLFTIQRFFENNLNVSETSRKLFIHRNTLVYRLDKIHKTTGLDLREFDQAIVFKIALMVKKYLAEKEATQ